MTELIPRPYQQESFDQIIKFLEGEPGNPCVVLPTGSGKSILNAMLCNHLYSQGKRVLMLTHVKELIEQNYDALMKFFPMIDCGIYSAGIRKSDISNPVLSCGIQSMYKKAMQIGHIDIIIIDEVHLVNHKNEGCYRRFISDSLEYNPNLRVVGLTATPYRLGHGYITDGDQPILTDIIEPTSITELIDNGYLSMLKSKCPATTYDVSGVKKTGGDYNNKSLDNTINTDDYNETIVREVVERARDRKHWLIFCAGVDHSTKIARALMDIGISAVALSGKNTKSEREHILNNFKSGKIRAVTNANILTTGFDFPDIDLVALLRPTMSPALYVQMVGRGMRTKSHTDHALILDFAGNVRKHGPITDIIPPKKSKGGGEAPVKVCDQCQEILHLSIVKCPNCGFEFPQLDKSERLRLHQDCVLGYETMDFEVGSWLWSVHTKASTGTEMLKCSYYQDSVFDETITEYLPVLNSGWAGTKSINSLKSIGKNANVDIVTPGNLHDLAINLTNGIPPSRVEYKMKNKYPQVIDRHWELIPF